MTWQDHFSLANEAHDGHLTLDEAKSGFKIIAKHFKDIDVEGKGYVTENDIRAWRALPKPSKRHKAEDDPLRPRHAFRLTLPEQRTLSNTKSDQLVPQP